MKRLLNRLEIHAWWTILSEAERQQFLGWLRACCYRVWRFEFSFEPRLPHIIGGDVTVFEWPRPLAAV